MPALIIQVPMFQPVDVAVQPDIDEVASAPLSATACVVFEASLTTFDATRYGRSAASWIVIGLPESTPVTVFPITEIGEVPPSASDSTYTAPRTSSPLTSSGREPSVRVAEIPPSIVPSSTQK